MSVPEQLERGVMREHGVRSCCNGNQERVRLERVSCSGWNHRVDTTRHRGETASGQVALQPPDGPSSAANRVQKTGGFFEGEDVMAGEEFCCRHLTF